MYNNKEYDILEIIHDNPCDVRQRELASAADLSLGMTNAVLKKLVAKGLLVMKRMNSRNIQYALTPEGIAEVARRSQFLIKRTLASVVKYRDAMDKMVGEIAKKGYTNISITGQSDLDFVVEWACSKHGIGFNCETGGSDEILFSEETLLDRLDFYI